MDIKEKRKELLDYIQEFQREALALENEGKFNWYYCSDFCHKLLRKVVEVS